MKPTPPFIRSPYNYDTAAAGDEASVKDFGPSLTIQSMTEDSDLNVIMRRFGVTGKMPDDVRPVTYADYEDIFDFQSAQNAVRAGQEAFDALPADIRARFQNNPQEYLEFCSDTKNEAEALKLGIVVAKPEAASKPIDTPPATPVAAPPKEEPKR